MRVTEFRSIFADKCDPGQRLLNRQQLAVQTSMLGIPTLGELFRPEEVHVFSGKGQVFHPPGHGYTHMSDHTVGGLFKDLPIPECKKHRFPTVTTICVDFHSLAWEENPDP